MQGFRQGLGEEGKATLLPMSVCAVLNPCRMPVALLTEGIHRTIVFRVSSQKRAVNRNSMWAPLCPSCPMIDLVEALADP